MIQHNPVNPENQVSTPKPFEALQAQATLIADNLVGPEAPYSKIGRDRRAKLRAAIAQHLIEFYKDGYFKGGNDTVKALKHGQ